MISRLLIEWSTPAIHCHTYFITQPTIDPNHGRSERNANNINKHVILLENELLVHYDSYEGNLDTWQGYSKLDCLFRLTTQETPELHITVRLWGELSGLHKRPAMRKVYACKYVTFDCSSKWFYRLQLFPPRSKPHTHSTHPTNDIRRQKLDRCLWKKQDINEALDVWKEYMRHLILVLYGLNFSRVDKLCCHDSDAIWEVCHLISPANLLFIYLFRSTTMKTPVSWLTPFSTKPVVSCNSITSVGAHYDTVQYNINMIKYYAALLW